ncbi:MAG TPA: dihydroorotate dehydrogenase electron transfer subunit [Tepidisphaeraceae bacterium]|nr:dihydroorotate dehydrogenase electron transfer subunit [Tepidisphaeraceae bacterium]
MRLPSFPFTQPGQFIQIACRDLDVEESSDEIDWLPGQSKQFSQPEIRVAVSVLRRPFSLAGRRETPTGVELEIIHRVVGIGTDWLSQLEIGDSVGILGPLGNQFRLPALDQTAILVGGGVGIPPMLYLSETLKNRRAIAFCGATTRDLLPLTINPDGQIGEFARHGVASVITTDDGSLGEKGFVTYALEKYLDSTSFEGQKAVIYTCGPELMMKRVADIANSRGIPCQIAVERAMACGMGTCQSCCIRVKKPDPALPPLAGKDWCYRLACTDGPVFSAAELLW